MDREKIALRLTEERARLGFTQANLARELAVSREGLRLYETGQREIGAEFLARTVPFGFDVQYILCGMRSANLVKQEQAAAFTPLQVINGGVSGVGIAQTGANVNVINTPKHVTRTTVKTEPGEIHISDQQKVVLQGLVKDVVDTELKLKQKPRSYQSVWSALNAHCKVSAYALIASADFEKAKKYLNEWMGRLHSMTTAPIKDGDAWRKRHYAYIKINSKSPQDSEAVSQYMMKNFKLISLTELSNDQLDKLYRYVAGRRSTRK